MAEIKIKSNGLRNELKEIRKSIDKLTNAIIMAQTQNTMRVITILLVAMMMSCASARNERLTKYREMTEGICVDNQNEVLLAQKLYITYVNQY